MNAKGVPDFNALQNAIDSVAGDAIELLRVRPAVPRRA
jgi:hypothetical protein